MSPAEGRDILGALHTLELRLTERLVRVEEKVIARGRAADGHETRITELEHACEVERGAMRERTNRLAMGLLACFIVAGTDTVVRLLPVIG